MNNTDGKDRIIYAIDMIELLAKIIEEVFRGCSSLKSIAIWQRESLIIKCSKDSSAHKYAEENHIKFELI